MQNTTDKKYTLISFYTTLLFGVAQITLTRKSIARGIKELYKKQESSLRWQSHKLLKHTKNYKRFHRKCWRMSTNEKPRIFIVNSQYLILLQLRWHFTETSGYCKRQRNLRKGREFLEDWRSARWK